MSGVLRIKSGGADYRDGGGNAWVSDAGYLRGSGTSVVTTDRAVTGTTNPDFFQTARYGDTEYAVPTANGSYTVTVYTAEIAPTGTTRTFDVVAEDQVAIDSLRPAPAGDFAATSRDFSVMVTDGELNLGFGNGTGQALVAGVKITPVAPRPVQTALSPIAKRYLDLGGTRSTLGPTIGNELAIAGGKVQRYQNGEIYWSSATGAHVVFGAIDTNYRAFGGPRSVLGFPTTDLVPTGYGVGFRTEFVGGSIYYTFKSRAHVVLGAIRAKWLASGGVRSSLGYPTTDEYVVTGGRRSDFQRGSITWARATNRVTVR